MKDADHNKEMEHAVASRLNNTGQTCVSSKIFIENPAIVSKLIENLIAEMLHLINAPFMDYAVSF